MTRPITVRDRLRYRFDATLARGTIGVIGWLAIITLAFVLLAGLLIAILGIRHDGEERTGFLEGIWLSLMRTLDPGTMGGDEGWQFRLIALSITIIGIFIVSTLIGLIASGIDRTVETLRKGRTLVVEEGHTLILGWSPKLHQVLAELEVANESERDPSVVILAPRDKVEMEDEVRDRAGGARRTRVVCRSGSPADANDLELVRPLQAKSILILVDDETGDPQVVKTVLALMRFDPGLERLRVTAEFTDGESAKAISRATGGRLGVVVSSDVIARVTAQVCRQSGLSAVFQELLDFDGDEIYFHADPALVGRSFGDAIAAYPEASAIGLAAGDGSVSLAPPMGRVIAADDRVIVIAADDHGIRVDAAAIGAGGADAPTEAAIVPVVERTLMIGWNPLAPLILSELDRYVAPGSHVRVLADPRLVELPVGIEGLANIAVEFVQGGAIDGDRIAEQVAADRYDQIIILCYRGDDVAASDARTLLTLLQVRQATQAEGCPNAGVRLVTELLDTRDVELAMVANPDDFVVSERLTSLMLAQLSENLGLRGVFEDLFDAEGVELVLVPASRYAQPGAEVEFGDVVLAARERGHVCVGYRLAAGAAEGGIAGGGVVVNPPKRGRVAFGADDQVLVLA